MGVDKTYNLGAIYVTATVYKNLALLRRRTNDFPIFAGPLYLHGHSDTATYSFFFSHLAVCLSDGTNNFSQLTMGSDEEAVLLKAIALAFNGVKQVTCTRHLRKNTGRKLDSLLGSRQPARGAVYNGLFGDSRIVMAADLITFNDAVVSFRTGPLASAPPAFQQYFEDSLLHNLCENVSAGRAGWTNNNCESFNHVLKQSIQWRP